MMRRLLVAASLLACASACGGGTGPGLPSSAAIDAAQSSNRNAFHQVREGGDCSQSLLGTTFALLATDDDADVHLQPGATVNGNAGVEGRTLHVEERATIAGSADTLSDTRVQNRGSINGGVVVNQALLTSATQNAESVSCYDAHLRETISSPHAIDLEPNQSLTIAGSATPAANVLSLASIETEQNSTLTFRAPAGSSFVVNVAGDGRALDRARILVSGGITAGDVVFNFTGDDGDIAIGPNATWNVTILAPDRPDEHLQHDAYLGGALLAGGDHVHVDERAVIEGTAPSSAAYNAYLPNGSSIDVVSEAGTTLSTIPITATTVGLDDAGNLYVLGNVDTLVQRYAPGTSTPNATYQVPPGIAMQYVNASANGEVVVEYSLYAAGPVAPYTTTFDVWNPGSSGGAPSYSFTVQNVSPSFALTSDGTIYTAAYNGTNAVYEIFPPGSATPSRTIRENIVSQAQQSSFSPNYMTVGPDGTLYVTEYDLGAETGSLGSPDPLAGLYIYSPGGSEKFVATTSDSNGPGPEGVALDAAGNIYVANNNQALFESPQRWTNDTLREIEVFAPGGTSVLRHITGNIDPIAIAVTPDGATFISSFGNFPSAVYGTYLLPTGGTSFTQLNANPTAAINLFNGSRSRSAFIEHRM